MTSVRLPPSTSPTDPVSNGAATRRPGWPVRRGSSFRFRLLALVAAVVLPQTIFSVVQLRRADRQARDNAEKVALQLATRIATRVDDHVSVAAVAAILGAEHTRVRG